MFLHVLDAAKEHQRIMIRTVDTDVFVLAVSQMQRIPHKEVGLAFGTGKLFITQSMKLPDHLVHRRAKLCQYSTHSLAVTLLEKGKRMRGMCRMHFLTLPTHSWKSLVHPGSYWMSVQGTSNKLRSVVEVQQQLLCKNSPNLDRILPTSAALKQHTLQASY